MRRYCQGGPLSLSYVVLAQCVSSNSFTTSILSPPNFYEQARSAKCSVCVPPFQFYSTYAFNGSFLYVSLSFVSLCRSQSVMMTCSEVFPTSFLSLTVSFLFLFFLSVLLCVIVEEWIKKVWESGDGSMSWLQTLNIIRICYVPLPTKPPENRPYVLCISL